MVKKVKEDLWVSWLMKKLRSSSKRRIGGDTNSAESGDDVVCASNRPRTSNVRLAQLVSVGQASLDPNCVKKQLPSVGCDNKEKLAPRSHSSPPNASTLTYRWDDSTLNGLFIFKVSKDTL